MKILITTEQIGTIHRIIKNLEGRTDIKELNIMYNPIVEDSVMIRYNSYFTTEDGAIKMDVKYICLDKRGLESNCVTKFGDSFYFVLRDYQPIKLDSPSIEII
jgi:hypothetical protein